MNFNFILKILLLIMSIKTNLFLRNMRNRKFQLYLSKNENHSNHFSENVENKKIISLSPGGYKGFYVLGICKFLKENYVLDNYVFSGASAGAWNSLMLCYKHELDEIINTILDSNLEKSPSIYEIEQSIKRIIVNQYTKDDFDLNRLYVGVTVIDNCKTNTTIYNDFENLEDAVNSCIASSHIPLVTGGLVNIYRNMLSFDGGFSKYPYLNASKSVLHIHPNMWNHFSNTTGRMKITDYTTLFSKSKFPFRQMVHDGYADSKKNKEFLDSIFIPR